MYEKFKEAYDKLRELLKNDRYFEAFILAYSILEDRVTATYFSLFKIRKFKVKSGYIPLFSKIKTLVAANLISAEDATKLKTIANDRNEIIHSYFLNDNKISKKKIGDIMSLVRNIDKKQKKQKKLLNKLNEEIK